MQKYFIQPCEPRFGTQTGSDKGSAEHPHFPLNSFIALFASVTFLRPINPLPECLTTFSITLPDAPARRRSHFIHTSHNQRLDLRQDGDRSPDPLSHPAPVSPSLLPQSGSEGFVEGEMPVSDP